MSNPVVGDSVSFSDSFVGVDLIPVSPDDDNDLTIPCRAIRCSPGGGAGTLRVTTKAGVVRNTSIALGETLMLFVVRVHSSGTTATGLEALI